KARADIQIVAAKNPAHVIFRASVAVIKRSLCAAADREGATNVDALKPLGGRQPWKFDAEARDIGGIARKSLVCGNIGQGKARLVEQVRAECVRLLDHDVVHRLVVSGTVSQQVAGRVLWRQEDVIAKVSASQVIAAGEAVIHTKDVF